MWLIRVMTYLTQQIVRLAETMMAHERVTHWAISRRIGANGDFVDRMMRGKDCQTGTYISIIKRFDEIWPDDLEWPRDIPRPSATGADSAA